MSQQRTPIIAGNWKMNKTASEAAELAKTLVQLDRKPNREILLCPAFTALPAVYAHIKDTEIQLGAQNLHWEKRGAYTGEISAEMLIDCGCTYVIIGHSERRQYFGETNETVNKRINAALNAGLKPIVCVGESLTERESGQTEQVVADHIRGGLAGLSEAQLAHVVIAYEPVWAIGTGKTATPDQANAVHAYIRQILTDMYNSAVAQTIRIQYGGSVKPTNVNELMAQPDIDGALVGGASLEAESFINIINFE
ncbi:MAG: triose-phosphate isomerase [Gemmatimonadetes bacterium]|nr:MAG: triose-phosphate isomerase [Gemmatimonadota bacterium]